LIYRGVDTFIDGRTELFGEKFFVDHNSASGLVELENLFRLLDRYRRSCARRVRRPCCSTIWMGGRRSIPTTSPPFICAKRVRCTRASL
jgi:hypothetical protein